MSSSFKINGKEFKNPIVVFLLMFLLVSATILPLTLVAYLLPYIITILALTVPVHFILRLCGRKGFYNRGEDGSYEWTISTEAFDKH